MIPLESSELAGGSARNIHIIEMTERLEINSLEISQQHKERSAIFLFSA
jgi:hypothetical protein